MKDLKDSVKNLITSMEGDFEYEKASGFKASEDSYFKHLPSDLSKEVVTKVESYNSDFIAAGGSLFGKLAVEAMAEDKSLKKATLSVPMGRNEISYSLDRTREYHNNRTPDSPTVIKTGDLRAVYDVKSIKKSTSFRQIRAEIAELATEKLK